jgi:hypothetical protein
LRKRAAFERGEGIIDGQVASCMAEMCPVARFSISQIPKSSRPDLTKSQSKLRELLIYNYIKSLLRMALNLSRRRFLNAKHSLVWSIATPRFEVLHRLPNQNFTQLLISNDTGDPRFRPPHRPRETLPIVFRDVILEAFFNLIETGSM